MFFWLAMEAIDKLISLAIASSNILLLFFSLAVQSYKFGFWSVGLTYEGPYLHSDGNYH